VIFGFGSGRAMFGFGSGRAMFGFGSGRAMLGFGSGWLVLRFGSCDSIQSMEKSGVTSAKEVKASEKQHQDNVDLFL